MTHAVCPVTACDAVGPNVFVLSIQSSEIASIVQPGQFINVRVEESFLPLLRRPFSVYHVQSDQVQIIFNVIGIGTKILSQKRKGDVVDVIGPLGCSFSLGGDYETALLVAGGMGVAPMPMMTSALEGKRSVMTFLGARTKNQIVQKYLQNVHVATDDGSNGFRGTVADLLIEHLQKNSPRRPKIFACGPNAMLKSLQKIAVEYDVPCECSLESAMACGIGICQGCPVERVGMEKKYSLICTEGTVFDSRTIKIA